jgi:hypothetical protein
MVDLSFDFILLNRNFASSCYRQSRRLIWKSLRAKKNQSKQWNNRTTDLLHAFPNLHFSYSR